MRLIPIFFSLFLLIPVGITYADFADFGEGREWFCNTERPDIEKNDYKKAIDFFNSDAEKYFLRDPEATMSEKGEHLIKLGLESIGKEAACLKEGHGIDPDSVAIFSPEVQEVFSYNMDKLIETAPTLVAYATVPEFGSIAMLILIMSIIGILFSTKKFNILK